MQNPEELCLKKITEAGKNPKVKMPNWDRAESRPSQKCVVAWEIYSESVLDMRQVVPALNRLTEKGVLEDVWKGDTVWSCLKQN